MRNDLLGGTQDDTVWRLINEKMRPADDDVLRDMVRTTVGEDLRNYRDRALLAIGWRVRSAIRVGAITVTRMSEDSRGLLIGIATSEPDQEGKGRT